MVRLRSSATTVHCADVKGEQRMGYLSGTGTRILESRRVSREYVRTVVLSGYSRDENAHSSLARRQDFTCCTRLSHRSAQLNL
jgi:hypothetical protein